MPDGLRPVRSCSLTALTTATRGVNDNRSGAWANNAPVDFVHRRVVDKAGTTVLVAEGIDRGDVVRFDVKLK